jgi:DNA-binding protein
MTGTRQIINYALTKIKQDWKIEMNAFSMDIAKVLQATEILKTRNPFLFQETKMLLQSKEVTKKSDEEEDEKTFTRNYSGISVCLSRNQFEVSDPVGYQKPKPRQFVQPLPRLKAEDKKSEPPKEEQKKGQGFKTKKKPSTCKFSLR